MGNSNSDPSPRYGDLLEAAYALGRADGSFAERLEPVAPLDAVPWCRGRSPAEFARLLWGEQPGTPPSGLELNAPLWYARGFAEALAAERYRVDQQRVAAAWAAVLSRATPRGSG